MPVLDIICANYFNSHPREGVTHLGCQPRGEHSGISIPTPARGVTLGAAKAGKGHHISIPTPVKGVTWEQILTAITN